jgi:riboflavin kinase/FMN adenylyltransferase
MFDGIHVGHHALLSRVVSEARRLGSVAMVFTFEPHPLKVLKPDRAPQLILSRYDRIEFLMKVGLDCIAVQKFDREFSRIDPREFVERYLIRTLEARKLIVGEDFAFGRDRKGKVDVLIALGAELGFSVEVFPPVQINGEQVSSSRIRRLIAEGKMAQVRALLGRFHFVAGRVRHGRHRGKGLGFPTANLLGHAGVVPPDGVYATLTEVEGQEFPSVTNVGTNPTFGDLGRSIETHIFDFSRDIYCRRIRVSFVERLRGEVRFPSVQALVEQIEQDAVTAQKVLRRVAELDHPHADR